MVSSAMPKVVPPRAKAHIRMGMSSFSRPFSLVMIEEMPASMAPVLAMTPRKPPTIRIKAAMSMASYRPSSGASATSPGVWPFCSTWW